MDVSKDWLEEQYHGNILSCKQIAEMVGVTRSTVERWMAKYGIAKRETGWHCRKSEHVLSNGVEYKTCSKCSQSLPLEHYVKDKTNADGLVHECKACRNAKKKERRIRMGGALNQGNKVYVIKYRERLRQERQQYHLEHKEEHALARVLRAILSVKRKDEAKKRTPRKPSRESRDKHNEAKKKWYWEHRDDHLAELRKRYALNPNMQFYNRQKRHKRKALERQQIATLTWEQWQECLLFFDNGCVYCGTHENITQEHIVPLSKGGSYSKHNIVPACSCCNLGRRAEPMEQWYKRQPFFNIKRLKRINDWRLVDGQEGLFTVGRATKWK